MHDLLTLEANIAYYGREGALARAAEAREQYAAGRAAVEACDELPPGPELLAAIQAAEKLDMDTASRIALAGCWERLRSWIDAQAMAAISIAAGTPDAASDAMVISDIAIMTSLSECTIGNRFALMRQVGASLPQAWEAQNAGQLTPMHVHALANVLREADDAIAMKVEAVVVPKAILKGWTPAELRAAARIVLLRMDPDGCEERARKARRDRSNVEFFPDDNMLGQLVVTGDAATLREVKDEIDRRAEALRRAGDTRSPGELRVQVVADMILGVETAVAEDSAAPDPAPQTSEDRPGDGQPEQKRRPRNTRALVVLSLSTLLGGNEPGELIGYGPITPAMARRLARDASLRKLICDPLSGRPVDLGQSSYRLSAPMQRWINVRDRTCRFPTCRRPAHYCDADHAEEFGTDGGDTSCDNCGLLCRKHHNYKTKRHWDLARRFDDVVIWTSPHGFTWAKEPASYFVDGFPDEPEPDEDNEALLDLTEEELAAIEAEFPPLAAIPPPDPPTPVTDDDIEHDQWHLLWGNHLWPHAS